MSQVSALAPDRTRRDSWLASCVLFGLIASHALLETARDALFLMHLPVSRLPWVYVALALAGFLISQGQRRAGRRLRGGRAVSVWLGLAALITGALYLGFEQVGVAAYYILYFWTGVVTAVVLIQFWMVLDELFSITQARRSFVTIGVGGVLGAIAGSALARVLVEWVQPDTLIACAALGFTVTALVALGLGTTATLVQEHRPQPEQAGAAGESEDGRPSRGLLDAAFYVVTQNYARGIALFALLSAAALTVGDYLFKSIVAAQVPPQQLSTFFSTTYLGMNSAALVVQVLLVGSLLRRSTLSVPLAILPALLLLSGVMVVLVGGVAAALMVKASDGVLRHSLHRTSSELMYLPFKESVRHRVKPFIDLVAQRSGQALASFAILAAGALELGVEWLAGLLISLCVLWLGGVVDLRRHYVDVFRGRVRQGEIGHEVFPELDTASLENLVAALDSEDDDEVVAALHILHREGRTRVVPTVLIHHPSEKVVELALRLFAATRRLRALPEIDAVAVNHPSAHLRATALTARSVLSHDEALLRARHMEDDASEVRATALVNLIAGESLTGEQAERAVNEILGQGNEPSKLALADAVRWRLLSGFDAELVRLARDPDVAVRNAALRAMGAVQSEALLPALIQAVGEEATRSMAIRSLTAYGERGLVAVRDALKDTSLKPSVRWHLPRALTEFEDHATAAAWLLDHLPQELSGTIRYRIIRSLEWLAQQDESVSLDVKKLRGAVRRNLTEAYALMDQQRVLEHGAMDRPERKTVGHDLLIRLSADKYEHALDRLFRLLGLLQPGERFSDIYRSLTSADLKRRADALELLRHIVRRGYREAVLGLVEPGSPAERLRRGQRYYSPLSEEYDELLGKLLFASSSAVRAIALFHVGELRLKSLRSRVVGMPASKDTAGDARRTLALLDGPKPSNDPAAASPSAGPS